MAGVDVVVYELRFILSCLNSLALILIHYRKIESFPPKFTIEEQTVMNTISIAPNLPPPIAYNTNSRSNYRSNRRFTSRRSRISAVDEVSTITFDPSTPQITWQIIVGSIAGVTPFVVAGIEFSKRIVAQKKCIECGGSGLVLIEDEYIRCPNCGGFLPWQSWRRFFSG